MKNISLDGPWHLAFAPEGEQVISHPDELASANLRTVPARVPGNVESRFAARRAAAGAVLRQQHPPAAPV